MSLKGDEIKKNSRRSENPPRPKIHVPIQLL
jgi:hypothetical protein